MLNQFPKWNIEEIQSNIEESIIQKRFKSNILLKQTIGGSHYIETMSRDESEQGLKLRKKKKWIELAKQMNHYERNIDRSAEELEQIVLPDNVRKQQIHKIKMIKCI